MATHSSILAWEIQTETGGLQSMGSQKSQTQRLYNNKARHPVGPIQSEVSGGPASSQPSRATLNIIPRAGEARPLTR